MTETSQSTGSTGKVVHPGNEDALRQAAGAGLLQAQASLPQEVPAIASVPSAPPPPPSLPPPVFLAPVAPLPPVAPASSQPQMFPPSPPPSRSSESQLPTSRMPSLPAVFSPELERALQSDSSPPSTLPAPPVAPPAHEAKTVVLTKPRAVAMRASWRAIVSSVMHVAVKVPGRVSAVSAASRAAWTQKRVGIACGVLGLAMIVGPLAFGIVGLSAAHLDKSDPASLVAAVVLARAAISVASMGIGYALLRIAERLTFPAAGLRLAPAPIVRPRA